MKSVLIKTKKLLAGDIIVANRILYNHYGIYAGNGKVIHYTSDSCDFGANVKVRETSLNQFVLGSEYKVLQFEGNTDKLRQFSREETVRRARSRKGECSYNLIFNNCEHFAIWCKTGINKSLQAEKTICAVTLLSAAVVSKHLISTSNN